ncbi:hypothetical protein B0H19DRAFT_1240416 [Mycena capillaripes]|nr:hypothetical protein B0H19DRAFT_1240416 [Mycena capillaripes]
MHESLRLQRLEAAFPSVERACFPQVSVNTLFGSVQVRFSVRTRSNPTKFGHLGDLNSFPENNTAWTSDFRNPNFTTEAAVRRLATFFVTATEFVDQFDFNEFIDGAGCNTGVKLADYLLGSTATAHGTALDLGGSLVFAARPQGDVWSSALRSNKYLRTFISVMQFATQDLPVDVGATMNVYEDLYKLAQWGAFFSILLDSSGYSYIVEIIDVGFLTFVVSLANKQIRWTDDGIKTVTTSILLPATVFYPVLSVLNVWLPRLEEPTSTQVFLSSALNRDWQGFFAVAIDQLEVKQQFDSGEYAARKACDNLEVT